MSSQSFRQYKDVASRTQVNSTIIAIAIAVIFATGAPWWWPYLDHHSNNRGSTSTTGDDQTTSPSVPGSNASLNSRLGGALLPASYLGTGAKISFKSLGLAHAGGDCEQPLPTGAQAAAVEDLAKGNTSLEEQLVIWNTAQQARRFVLNDTNAVQSSGGSCVMTVFGKQIEFKGPYAGQPPAVCRAPGAYSASQSLNDDNPASKKHARGFIVDSQCGRITITVFPESLSGPGASLDTANGYLTTAISYLDTISGLG